MDLKNLSFVMIVWIALKSIGEANRDPAKEVDAALRFLSTTIKKEKTNQGKSKTVPLT